jgi:hypothetical protein
MIFPVVERRTKRMNLLQLLMGAMTSQSSVGSVSGKTGLSNKQVQQLMLLAIPLLLKYMTKNASSGNGAQSLLGALAQHTDQKNMDKQIDDADEEDGSKIISHILGSSQNKVTQDLSVQTGLKPDQISKVLAILAPAMMSGVSQAASSASASNEPARPAGPSLSGLMGSGIFGSLLGLGKKEKEDDDPEFNGTALLQALLGAKK